MFFCPCAAHSSISSGIGDEGVMGKIAATSVNAYAIYAAAVFPSIVFITFDICISSYLLIVTMNIDY
jgi:hypothetical protein